MKLLKRFYDDTIVKLDENLWNMLMYIPEVNQNVIPFDSQPQENMKLKKEMVGKNE